MGRKKKAETYQLRLSLAVMEGSKRVQSREENVAKLHLPLGGSEISLLFERLVPILRDAAKDVEESVRRMTV